MHAALLRRFDVVTPTTLLIAALLTSTPLAASGPKSAATAAQAPLGAGVAGGRSGSSAPRNDDNHDDVRVERSVVVADECFFTLDSSAMSTKSDAKSAMLVERCEQHIRYARPPGGRFKRRLRKDEQLAMQLTTNTGRTIDVDSAALRPGDDGEVVVDIPGLVAPDVLTAMRTTVSARRPFARRQGTRRAIGNSFFTERLGVTVDADAASTARLLLHNSAVLVQHETRGGRHISRFVLNNLEPAPTEPSMPEPRTFLPWWSLDRVDEEDPWARELGFYPGLLDTAAAEPSPVRVDVSTCKARRCRLDKAVDAVHAAADIVPGADRRLPGEAVATGRITPAEAAVALWRALRELGEAPKLAFSSSFPEAPLVRDVAVERDIDRWFVVVDGDAAGAAPIWIDPACRSCRVAELRAAQLGRSAVVLTHTERATSTQLLTTTGTLQAQQPSHRRIDIVVGADATALVTVDVDAFMDIDGEGIMHLSEDARRGNRTAYVVKEAADEGLPNSTAVLETSGACARSGRCNNHYVFKAAPGVVVGDNGTTMAVPLWTTSRTFVDKTPRGGRRTPFIVEAAVQTQTLRVTPPPGWHAIVQHEAFSTTATAAVPCSWSARSVLDGRVVELVVEERCTQTVARAEDAEDFDAARAAIRKALATRIKLVRDTPTSTPTSTTKR